MRRGRPGRRPSRGGGRPTSAAGRRRSSRSPVACTHAGASGWVAQRVEPGEPRVVQRRPALGVGEAERPHRGVLGQAPGRGPAGASVVGILRRRLLRLLRRERTLELLGAAPARRPSPAPGRAGTRCSRRATGPARPRRPRPRAGHRRPGRNARASSSRALVALHPVACPARSPDQLALDRGDDPEHPARRPAGPIDDRADPGVGAHGPGRGPASTPGRRAPGGSRPHGRTRRGRARGPRRAGRATRRRGRCRRARRRGRRRAPGTATPGSNRSRRRDARAGAATAASAGPGTGLASGAGTGSRLPQVAREKSRAKVTRSSSVVTVYTS